MRIHMIFGQYPVSYPGELMPSVLEAVDEYAMDSGADAYYDERLAFYRKQVADGTLTEIRELVVTVPDEMVVDLFITPERTTLWKQVDR